MSENMLVDLMANMKEHEKQLERMQKTAESSVNKAIAAIPQNIDLAVHAAIASLSVNVTEHTASKVDSYLKKLDNYNAVMDNKLRKFVEIGSLLENTISIIKPTISKKIATLVIAALLITCIPLAASIFFSNRLVYLQQQICAEQATLNLLQNKTWNLELFTQNNEKWILLPDGAKFVGQATDSRGRKALQISD